MLAEVPARVVDIGSWAGAFVAVVAALRTPPGRLLWRRLVAKPIGEWVDAKLHPLAAKVDLLDVRTEELGVALVTHMADEMADKKRDTEQRQRRQGELDSWRQVITDRLDQGDGRMGSIEGKLDDTLDQLKAGNPEVRT